MSQVEHPAKSAGTEPDFSKPVVLYVEGEMEHAYATSRIAVHGWQSAFTVIKFEGLAPPSVDQPTGDVKKLPKRLRDVFAFKREPTNLHLALWFDAESDRAARFRQMTSGLREVGLPVPEGEGTLSPPALFEGNPITTSLLLMPATGNGCFEMALLQACQLTQHLQCAEKFLDCIPHLKDSEEWQAKVKMQSMWKAHLITVGSRKPDFPIESTFRADSSPIWNFNHAALRPAENYLKMLAGQFAVS